MKQASKKPQVAPAKQVVPERLPLGLKRYLYATAATTGAAIMIVEILGAKMLAPYVGTSHFVWTAQIAVTLMALATGYYAGGRLVDRTQGLGWLYWGVFGAAGYLGLTVLLAEPVAYRCLDFNLAVGSLLASTLLFFVPLALLAMVGPFFVRVLTVAVTGVGGNVGRLTAISTLGSFAGTVLIGYVFIPFFPNSVTMFAVSAALLAVTGGYFLGWGRKQTSPATVVTAVLVGLLPGGIGVGRDQLTKGPGWHEVYRADSNCGRLQVIEKDNGSFRYFLNDCSSHNICDIRSNESVLAYTYMLHGLARGYNPHIKEVLCIGLGVGIVPMRFAREGVRVDVVEINPAVVPLAQHFFDLEPARLNLSIDDGRHFVNRCLKTYDAVVLDAFLGDSMPAHLMSREAFRAIQRLLRPGGVLVINSFGDMRSGKDFLMASLNKTLKEVFHVVRIHTTDDDRVKNVYFVASDRSELKLGDSLRFDEVHELCREQVKSAWKTVADTDPRHGVVLTDDYNPVDYYDAANREQVRRMMIAAYGRR
jgi:spermidine synthase